jgi:hypothetical protein
MRHSAWLLIVFAGTGGAQWRRFGEGQPALAPSSLARDILAVHGAVRARVGVAPLAWSDRLAARAQDWADTLLARQQFAHRPNSTYGGPRSPATTTTAQTDVAACAGTTRKSSGPAPRKWDAQWPEAEDARFGFATTIRRAIGPASGPINSASPRPSVRHRVNHVVHADANAQRRVFLRIFR